MNTKRSEMLSARIEMSGLKHKAVMKALGIKSYSTFRGRLKNPSRFSVKEIEMLSEILHLTSEDRDRIFFTKEVA